MTMHINLSPEMESFIKGKVASGDYGNATEVIRDAIRRMKAEETRLAAWQAAVAEGVGELDRGESLPYSAAELDAIAESARKAMHSADPVNPDVRP
ncbi:type II toxin-antitoxin system ParD family antitoxin [Derxia lacustris]|uniref:type II toxin-antitoxin system ParD family antitoxin n=1 Tax=Derxia lacustris TaxID=764842 RepID=UPI000A1707AF|nr:type II toxin-antitoxin system ParD family antitoxin [Derxia lacustris]